MAGWSERRSLTHRERATLRRLIDAARRARIAWDGEPRCARCGVEREDELGRPRYALGCRACADRRAKHRSRARRAAVTG